jgi:hypothetical protein
MLGFLLSIFCGAGLMVMNSFSFCLLWKFLLLFQLFRIVLLGRLVLVDSCFLSGLEIHQSMPSLCLEFVEKSDCYSDGFAFIYDLSLPF